MRWIWDNAVLVAFLVGLSAVLLGIALAAIRGLGAWRAMRAATRTMGAAGGALSDDVARVTAAVAGLSDRSGEVQTAVALVRERAAAIAVLARHVGVAQRVLLAPVRYLGR